MNTKGWAGDIQCDDNPSSICGLEISFVSADIQDIDIKLIPVNQFCNINNPGDNPDLYKGLSQAFKLSWAYSCSLKYFVLFLKRIKIIEMWI